MTWAKDDVMAVSDAWIWVPSGAETFEVDGVPVIAYPEWAYTPFRAQPLDTGRGPDQLPELIEKIRAAGAARGKPSMTWWISPSTRPTQFADAIVTAGAQLSETCDIYAFDLSDGLPQVGDIDALQTQIVSDAATLDDFELVHDTVWGTRPKSAARRAEQLAGVSRTPAQQQGCRVVAYLDGAPVSMGGLELADGVARLWGAATLESARGRGAYRAVLQRRLEVARELGATLALVHAQVGTSGPIVRRCGFTSFGVGRGYEMALG